jgi:hypothetical protein
MTDFIVCARRIFAAVVVLTVASFGQSNSCQGEESDAQRLNDWVSTTYRPAYARLRAPLANVQATARIENHNLEDGCQSKANAVHYEKAGSGVVVLDVTYRHPSDKRPKTSAVYCATGEYAFSLSRAAADGPFVIKMYDNDKASLPRSSLQTSYVHSTFVRAATQINGISVLELLDDLQFRCTKFDATKIDDDECRLLEFDLVEPSPFPNYVGGQITFSESADWAVREYTIRLRASEGSTSHIIGNNEYKKWAPGDFVFPLRVREAQGTVVRNPPAEHELSRTTEFLTVNRDVVRDEQFTLRAYGLPEFGERQRSYYPFDSWGFWVCVGAVAATTIGLRCKRRTVVNA